MTKTSRSSAAVFMYIAICSGLLYCACAVAQDSDQDFAEAVKLFEEKSYRGAITKLEAVTEAAPEMEPAWYYLGVAKLRTDDPEGALQALQKAAQLRPGRPGISLHIGEIYERQGAYEQAVGAYQDELRHREGHYVAEVFNALGRTFYYSGRYQEALEALRHASEQEENYIEAIFHMGGCQYQLGNYERALKHYDTASKTLKEWDRLVARLEQITKKEERRELTASEQRDKQKTAEDLAQKYGRAAEFVVELTLRPALNIAAGDAADANEEWAGARNAYRHALEVNEGGVTTDPVTHTRIGRTSLHEAQKGFYEYNLLYKSIGIVEQAIAKAEEAIGYSDAYAPTYELLGEIYAFQAATYISDAERDIVSHTYQDALAQFDLALDKDPHYVQALLHRALTLIALDQPDKAIDDLQAALDLDPRNPDLYAALASAQATNEDYEQAIKTAQTALILDPDHADASNVAGLAYYYLGDLGLATEYFTNAIKADPTKHQPYTNLGNTFFQLGSWHRARAQYEKALDRIPKPALANTAYQRSYLYYLVAQSHHYAAMYDKEVEALNKALALDAAYLDALVQLADAYVELGQYRAAEEALGTALDVSPDPESDARIYVKLGALFERERRPHEALTAYGAALAVQSDNIEAKEALERLQAG